MSYLKISFGIFVTLAVSRLIPHPPNFTSLIALSFYVPVFFGLRFIPVIIGSFLITDIFLGFHNLQVFTWGSVFVIGYISQFFIKNFMNRISGALLGAIIFFIISNFGVFALGSYGYTFKGLISCYILAIPFFTNTILSTFIFSFLIEAVYKIFHLEKKLNFLK
mgnify:CR=1 FL=1|tara:strand:- start:315 stop:806 length:492 start_codon:yes stop_codon:yes gene_type:complete